MDENFVSGRAKKAQSFLLSKYSADRRSGARNDPQKSTSCTLMLFSHILRQKSSLFYNFVLCLENMPFRHKAAHPRQRIYVCIPSDKRSRIQNAVAAHLPAVAQHRAELFQTSRHL